MNFLVNYQGLLTIFLLIQDTSLTYLLSANSFFFSFRYPSYSSYFFRFFFFIVYPLYSTYTHTGKDFIYFWMCHNKFHSSNDFFSMIPHHFKNCDLTFVDDELFRRKKILYAFKSSQRRRFLQDQLFSPVTRSLVH